MLRNLFALAMILSVSTAMAEEKAAHESAFAAAVAKYDANKDGSLSKEEISKIEDKAAKEAVEALDANKDGSVDAKEGAASK